jgi:type II secretory pathway pseudopilin PulG
MTNPNPTRRRPHPSEQGFLLVAVMFMLAVLVIAMAVAAPRIKAQLQRDRDLETMHRGKQYIRALQLYYRKFNAYPPNVDALVKTNEIRFLRKKYIDPTTGKEEWKPIMFGQNKAPTALGFFGQPIAGSTLAGIGPSGGNGLNGAQGNNNSGFGNNSSSFGNNNSTLGNNNSTFGNNNNSTFGNNNSTFGNNSNSALGSNSSGTNSDTPNGAGGSSSSSTDPNASAFGGPGNSSGSTGQTFGGAGIIGFSPGSPKESILVYKTKKHYNEWEFVYDPAVERMTIGGNTGGIGQPASSTTTPVGASPFGGIGGTTGGSTGGTTGGSTGGTTGGTNPPPPPPPNPPQQ